MPSPKRKIGDIGEEVECKYLETKGFRVREHNYLRKGGEIDIVASKEGILVFVEVKTRFSYTYGLPEESVTPQKINSIVRTGQYFKLLNPQTPDLMRVDVVAIDYVENTTRLLKNVSQ